MGKYLKKTGKVASCLICTVLLTVTTCFGKEEDKRLYIFSELGLEYSDNIFGLTEDQISRMNQNDPDDAASGRFRGMSSLSDYILKPRMGMKWCPDWSKFALTAWLQYNYYIKNSDSSYPEGRIMIKYPINKKSSFIFRGSSIIIIKKKNYLSKFNDINENGNISKDERTYSEATYNEFEGMAGYRL
jgi:hypothetical protein